MSAQQAKGTSIQKIRNRIFVRTLLILFFGLVVAVTLFNYGEVRHDIELLKKEQTAAIKLRQQLIREYFSHIRADLFYLSRQNELSSYLQDQNQDNWQSLADEYLNFVQSHHNYDQIRFIDPQGQERARANYNDGQPYLVPVSQLQDKRDRYYFKRSIILEPGEVFTSVFDLNIEAHQVEIPYKPMLRFATPVTDSDGEKAGVVVINYLGKYLLAAIDRDAKLLAGDLMLLNPQGYWLLHPDQGKEWGFQFPQKNKQKFPLVYPQLWSKILAQDEGQFETAAGIVTFATVYSPYMKTGSEALQTLEEKTPATMRFWKLVSFVPEATLARANQRLQLRALYFVGGFLLCSIFFCWKFAWAVARRSHYRQEIERLAHLDKLTGLTSRALFDDRLLQSFERAKRSGDGFALLYIDLDGFKAVNDQFGHAAGDEVLQNSALRMRRVVRRADTVARIGGDEFCIIIEEVKQPENVEEVAEKLLNSLHEIFEVKGREVQIGASIGISLFPRHADQPEALLKKADEAMYAAKKSGKNVYRLAAESLPPRDAYPGDIQARLKTTRNE